MGCVVAIVAATPYRGDDLINKDVRTTAHAAGQTLFDVISSISSAWMTNQGRFFPGSLAWSYSLFWFVDSRVGYKLVLGLATTGAVAVFALLVARLTGRWKSAALFVPIVLGVIQLRTWHDGIDSFAGLLPITAGLSVLAVVILISRRGPGWAAIALLSYSLAVITYEAVVLFVPVMVAVVVWRRRTWRPALAIVIPAVVELGITAYLKMSLHVPAAPGYTISLDPRAVLVTFAKQVLAAFPLSQWFLSGDSMPAIGVGSITISLLVVGVPAFLAVAELGRSSMRATRMEIIAIAGFGAWIWLSSSALIAITTRWQAEIVLGQGYLSVVYGYFGLALCLLSAVLLVERVVAGRSERAIGTWRYGSALVIAIIVSLTFAGNITVASIP